MLGYAQKLLNTLTAVCFVCSWQAFAIQTQIDLSYDTRTGSRFQFQASGSVIETLRRASKGQGFGEPPRILPRQSGSPPSSLTPSDTFFENIGGSQPTEPRYRRRRQSE